MKQPKAKVLAHPECDENILMHSDFIGSTSALINYVNSSDDREFIIGTEPGVIHQMQKRNPKKEFFPLPNQNGCACNECPHMRLNTVEKIIDTLSSLKNEINAFIEVCKNGNPAITDIEEGLKVQQILSEKKSQIDSEIL